MASNTSARPSDAYPPCPDCDSEVFVDALSYKGSKYWCNLCSSTFIAVGGYVPAESKVQS